VDPNEDGTGTDVKAEILDTEYGDWDNSLRPIYDGDPRDDPATASGNWVYRLDVVAGPDCDTPDPSRRFIHGFKVFATGQVSVVSSAFSILAADADGPFISPLPAWAGGVDTGYNGVFDLFVRLPASGLPGQVTFTDADADDLGDPEAPGRAIGANPEIQYRILNSQAREVWFQDNPSGDYDVLHVPPEPDEESLTVDTEGVGGMWRWRWENVLTENNIRLTAPALSLVATGGGVQVLSANPAAEAALGSSGAALEVYGAPVQPLKVTSAEPIDYWLDNRGEIRGLLPVVLGELERSRCGHRLAGSRAVNSTREASRILSASADECQDDGSWERLLASLLAAKLNVRAAARHGETLRDAYLYGTALTVGEVMDEADSLIVHLCAMQYPRQDRQHCGTYGRGHFSVRGWGHSQRRACASHLGLPRWHWHDHSGDRDCTDPDSPEGQAAIEELVVLLDAVNLGDVTYRAPVAAPPATLAAPVNSGQNIAAGSAEDSEWSF